MIKAKMEVMATAGVEIKQSLNTGYGTANYTAQFPDATFNLGVVEATVLPTPDSYTKALVNGETEQDRFESAVADVLATETDSRMTTIQGWVLGKPDLSARKYVYDVEKFVPGSAKEESDVLGQFGGILPYDLDIKSGYSLYRFTNQITEAETLSFVHRIGDENLPKSNGQWEVYTESMDDYNDDEETE